MDNHAITKQNRAADNQRQRSFRAVQILIVGLLVLITCLPADAGNRNRLQRPVDSEPTLKMQTPTLEPTNGNGKFDLRLRKSVVEDGVGEGVIESGTAAETAVPNLTIRLEGGVTQVELQKLSKYDVVVLLDRSHSMRGQDCPPYSYDPVRGRNMGITRWDWCREQTKPLASLTGRSGQSLTIVTFYSTFQYFRNVTIKTVEKIFREGAPNVEVGTCLRLALADVLENYFQRRDAAPRQNPVNPLALAIVTDGGVRSSDIEQILLNASNRMRDPNEIHITLLLIGAKGPRKNSAGIWYLDDTLRRYGARYTDFISIVPFNQLERLGLSKALISVLP